MFLYLSVSHSVHRGYIPACISVGCVYPRMHLGRVCGKGVLARGCAQELVCGHGVYTPVTATAACGTHPTGMHPCLN